MKKILFLAVTALSISLPSMAKADISDVFDWLDLGKIERGHDRGGGFEPGRGPGPGRPGPGRPGDGDWDRGGRCQVNFEQCRIEIFGNCVKWKNRSLSVPRRDARDACWIAERNYGEIRRCRVHCDR